MKSILLVLLVLISGPAFSKNKILGQTYFDDYGWVSSDKVCFDKDQNIFKYFADAHISKTCTKSYVDRSENSFPKVVCSHYEYKEAPAKVHIGQLTIRIKNCLLWSKLKKCKQFEIIEKDQSLEYMIAEYPSWDYQFENPSIKTIPIRECH